MTADRPSGTLVDMNVMHSSRNDCWYTPQPIVDMVHRVLGRVTFSPACDATANRRIQADRYITREQDGLKADWGVGPTDAIYLNPPGGKSGNRSISGLFWSRLMEHRHLFGHAVYMAFSAEQLAVTQKPGQLSLMDFPFCVPAKRIRFDLFGATGAKSQPSHSNVIVYVPGHINRTDLFVETFSALGKCRA